MVVRFQVVSPPSKQRTFTVRLPILLGRGEEAKFRIQHDLVSRRHCEFFEEHGEVFLRDLGSTNGTFLNDQQVPASGTVAVPSGAFIRVGGLSFTIGYERAPTDTTASPVPHESGGEHGSIGDGSAGHAIQPSGPAREPDARPAEAETHDLDVEHPADHDEPFMVVPGAAADTKEVGPWAMLPTGEEPLPAAPLPAAPGPLVAPATPVRHSESAEDPTPPATAFDFLSTVGGGPASEAVAWPSDENAPGDDGPDDDQLNAFFKGLE